MADRVGTSGQVMRIVGVEAFRAMTRPAHATARTRSRPIGRDCGIAIAGVGRVSLREILDGDVGFNGADPPSSFEPADGVIRPGGREEPVSGRHRRAVALERRVAGYHRHPVMAADDDVEGGLRDSTEELGDDQEILLAGHLERRVVGSHRHVLSFADRSKVEVIAMAAANAHANESRPTVAMPECT